MVIKEHNGKEVLSLFLFFFTWLIEGWISHANLQDKLFVIINCICQQLLYDSSCGHPRVEAGVKADHE